MSDPLPRNSNGLSAFALVLLTGCAQTLDVDAIPPDIEWVALVELGLEDEVFAASPLLKREPELPLALYSSAERLGLIGFDARLTPVMAREDVQPEGIALKDARQCQTRLPQAQWWSNPRSDPESTQFNLQEAPRLTASWLGTTCEDPGPQGVSVHLACVPVPCLRDAPSVSACQTALDLSSCGLGIVDLHRSALDEACLDTPPTWSCTARNERPENAQIALSCTLPLVEGPTPCDVTVYQRSAASPFKLDGVALQTVDLLPQRAIDYPAVPGQGNLEPHHLGQGRAFGLAAIEDEVWVTHLGEDGPVVDCFHGAEQPSTALSRLSAQDLSVIDSRSVQPCLQSLVPDGEGGALAVSPGAMNRGWQLSRLDSTGTSALSRELTMAPMSEGWWVAGVIPLPQRQSVLVATSREQPAALQLTELSLADLSVVRTTTVSTGPVQRLVPGQRDTLLATQGGQNPPWNALQLDLQGRLLKSERVVEPMFRGNVNLLDIMYHEATDREIFSVGRDDPSMRVWTTPENVRSDFYEYAFTMASRLSPWPSDPRYALVLGIKPELDGRVSAIMQLFDPVQVRLLPGARVIGEGAPTQVVQDAQGRTLVLLGWTGQLLRLQ